MILLKHFGTSFCYPCRWFCWLVFELVTAVMTEASMTLRCAPSVLAVSHWLPLCTLFRYPSHKCPLDEMMWKLSFGRHRRGLRSIDSLAYHQKVDIQALVPRNTRCMVPCIRSRQSSVRRSSCAQSMLNLAKIICFCRPKAHNTFPMPFNCFD